MELRSPSCSPCCCRPCWCSGPRIICFSPLASLDSPWLSWRSPAPSAPSCRWWGSRGPPMRSGGGGERVTALGQNANNSAMILAAGFVVLLGLQYGAERPLLRPRWLVAPILALLGLSVVDTGSRGGIVALGAGLLPFMFSGARTLWLVVRNAVIAALAIGLVIF